MSLGFALTSRTDVQDSQSVETTKGKFLPDNVAEHDRYGGGSIMVWGGISLRGRTELHVINNGTLTAENYRDEILAVHLRP